MQNKDYKKGTPEPDINCFFCSAKLENECLKCSYGHHACFTCKQAA